MTCGRDPETEHHTEGAPNVHTGRQSSGPGEAPWKVQVN